MADETDRSEELYGKLSAACDTYQAADVVYAIGMLLAFAIKTACTTQDPAPTMEQIRAIVDLELKYSRSRVNKDAALVSSAHRA